MANTNSSEPKRTKLSADKCPSRYDWSRYMSTIKQLYIDEDMTLKEVMEVMENQHAFVATPKMYKTRLRKWGLSKYITTSAMETAALPGLLGEGDHQGSVTLASGRVVDVDRLTSHLLRKKLPTASLRRGSQESDSYSAGTPVPSPRATAIKSPDILYISESILTQVRIYVSSRMMDIAFANKSGTLGVAGGLSDIFYASRELLQDGKVDEAVALLRQAPEKMNILLREEPPKILDHLFMAIAHLRDIPGEMVVGSVKALVKYAAATAVELGWPSQHPLRRILSGFASLNEKDALAQYDLATRGWKFLIEMLDAELGVPNCSLNFPRWLNLGETSGYDVLPGKYLAKRQCSIYRQTAAEHGEGSVKAAKEMFLLTELERQKVNAHGGSQVNLQRLIDWTLRSIPEGTLLEPKYHCEMYLADIHRKQGNRGLAEHYLRACIATGIRRHGEKDPKCLHWIVKLEGWLAEWGEYSKIAELQLWKASIRDRLEELGK